MNRVPFVKMVGTGNDFVVLDAIRHRLQGLRSNWGAVARGICHRRTGIGADGLLLLDRSRKADVRMRIFNPDGSEPSMCGNGIRCLARYAHDSGMAKRTLSIETRAGIKQADIGADGQVSVDMGEPRMLAHIPNVVQIGSAIGPGHAAFIDSGVPHLVCWVKSIGAIDVETLGRRLRSHRRFQPAGTNVDFVEVVKAPSRSARVHRYQIRLRTYERGVEAETQACGTGAVAASAAVCDTFPFLSDERSEPGWFEVDVQVPGGRLRVSLSIAWRAVEGRYGFGHAILRGDALEVCSGTFRWNGRDRG